VERVGVLTFYGVLLLAGGQDVIADKLGLPIEGVTITFQVLVFVLPIATAVLTWRLCRDLQRARSAAMFEEDAPPPVGPAKQPLEDAGTTSSFSDAEPPGGRDPRRRRD
jgi:hypothetical protein